MFAAHVAKERKKYEAAPMEKFIASKISYSISVGGSVLENDFWTPAPHHLSNLYMTTFSIFN